MNTNGLFITGTGTDVGKTFASGFILSLLKSLGRRALYYKPIQCGHARLGDHEYPEGDSQLIHELIGHADVTNTWRLRSPSSPHLAFAFEGLNFDMQPIQEKLVSSRKHFDFIVMEGAGGIRVPISDKLEMTDLARTCSFPVLVVAEPGLGTINHTLLTLEHLSSHRIPVAGFIFCETKPGEGTRDALAADNAHVIQARTGMPFLGTVPFWKDGWSFNALQDHPLREFLQRSIRS